MVSAGLQLSPSSQNESGHIAPVLQPIPQLTSQLHDSVQVTLPAQACIASHSMRHAPVPQRTAPAHALFAVQSTMHVVAPAQSTPPEHAVEELQLTEQGTPSGHTTLSVQAAATSQLITHVPLLQLRPAPVHTLAHDGASIATVVSDGPSLAASRSAPSIVAASSLPLAGALKPQAETRMAASRVLTIR